MKETRKTVALIYGGRGYESEVSLRGAGNIRPIIEKKYNCLPVFIDKEGRWLIEGKELFPTNIRGKGGFFCPKSGEFFAVDCAFPLLHGDFGEDGVVQGSLECASVPYVGCDVSGGAVCRDKAFLKAAAKELITSGVTVNCLLPGYVKTDMNAQFDEEEEKAILRRMRQKEALTPEDVANAILTTLSQNLTGKILPVNSKDFIIK